ncbi:MAG: hypothetical protein JWO02_122 [Solirubrobacterales bacterium]|nr:hypothetical protein [Solirubrobacterales bacterium]
MRLAICTVATVLLLAAPASASLPCHRPAGATTVISSRYAAVYTNHVPGPGSLPSKYDSFRRYWGCVRPFGRLHKLYDTIPKDIQSSDAGQFRLAGHFVATVITVTNHYGTTNRRVIVTDLTEETDERAGSFGTGNLSAASGPISPLDVLRLKLDSGGAVAWLQRDADPFGKNTADRLLTLTDDDTVRQLDQAQTGQITTMHLRNHRLTWKHAGTPRSARLTVASQ